MPTPLVWSERVETVGVTGLHDCTQSSALMCLVYAGKTDYEYGIYTPTERNALDASDDRPDNTGATLDGSLPGHGDLDAQLLNRYGVRMHRLPDDTDATLRKFISTPGYAFLLQGTMGSFPAGHKLRIWQPSFTGNHAVCVVTLGNGKVLWLDPLAPNRNAGTTATVHEAMTFAWTGSTYSRYLKQDELLTVPNTGISGGTEPMTTVTIATYPAARVIRFKGGTTYQAWDPAKSSPAKSITPTRDSWAHADASVQVTHDPQHVPNGWFHRMSDGIFAGLLIFQRDVTIDPVVTPAVGDVTAAVNAAVDPLNRRIASMKQKVAAFAADIADD
jgi:hypothetical protein